MNSIIAKMLILLLLPVVPAALNTWLNPDMPPWTETSLEEDEVNLSMVEAWPEQPLWIDARSTEAFEADHISGAVNLNLDHFEDQMIAFLDVWQPNQQIVIYCDSRQCGASKEVAQRLRDDMGIDNIYVLKGGWQEWLDSKQ
ncbi:rhodanese-like domain-containing protein [Rubellicoccus peritrichatus]|uniref:Rhodanese-like domain-containing protein n=1 Tax=Rubellicoccus peritrichatus TaxID=3080537 RepID=A0AAQ3LEJ5_9BACT|nr:rhodanese-like domain-containing protein [Puniceicoccus sp. CR14]WOO43252.1 rhodanese-like domain-containing protein [Puniceicoccus sp. CR14]